MVSLLISLLIFLLVAGIIWYIISLIPLPPPFGAIAQAVFLLILLLIALSYLFGWGGVAHPILR